MNKLSLIFVFALVSFTNCGGDLVKPLPSFPVEKSNRVSSSKLPSKMLAELNKKINGNKGRSSVRSASKSVSNLKKTYGPKGKDNKGKNFLAWFWNPCSCGWNFWCIYQSYWRLVNYVRSRWWWCLNGLNCKLRKKIITMIFRSFLNNCNPWLRNFLLRWFRWTIRNWCH